MGKGPENLPGSCRPLFLALLFLSSCGYVGDPLPPLANIPRAIADLAAVQRGGRLIVHFTLPERTTEDVALKEPLRLELRVGDKQIPEAVPKNGFAEYDIPAAEWAGKTVAISARAIGSNGKPGAWSTPLALPVVAAPQRPADLEADPAPEGVLLTWTGPPGDFIVLRRTGDEKNFSQIGTAQEDRYLDRTAEFGKPQTYLVQRVVKLPGGRSAESELSTDVSLTPRDTFPPAVPTGLLAVAAPQSVELTWDRSPETDLAGYRVYRALGDGGFEKVADVSQIPSWSDKKVETGKTYRYQVSAFDRAGNESARSAPVQVTTQ